VPLIREILLFAIWVMMMAILASIVISWLRQFRVRIPPWHPVVRAIEGTADLLLRPIQRNLPTAAGGFDFSPVVAFLLLYILRALIIKLL